MTDTDRYPFSTWASLSEREQSLWAGKAVADQGGDLSDVLNAIEKPWHYYDEVKAYWLAMLAEEKKVKA
jgi:hypothetical protein